MKRYSRLKYLPDNHQNNWLDYEIKYKYHKNEHKLQPQQIHEKVDDFETNYYKKKYLIINQSETRKSYPNIKKTGS
jgi:hypothetical protein